MYLVEDLFVPLPLRPQLSLLPTAASPADGIPGLSVERGAPGVRRNSKAGIRGGVGTESRWGPEWRVGTVRCAGRDQGVAGWKPEAPEARGWNGLALKAGREDWAHRSWGRSPRRGPEVWTPRGSGRREESRVDTGRNPTAAEKFPTRDRGEVRGGGQGTGAEAGERGGSPRSERGVSTSTTSATCATSSSWSPTFSSRTRTAGFSSPTSKSCTSRDTGRDGTDDGTDGGCRDRDPGYRTEGFHSPRTGRALSPGTGLQA